MPLSPSFFLGLTSPPPPAELVEPPSLATEVAKETIKSWGSRRPLHNIMFKVPGSRFNVEHRTLNVEQNFLPPLLRITLSDFCNLKPELRIFPVFRDVIHNECNNQQDQGSGGNGRENIEIPKVVNVLVADDRNKGCGAAGWMEGLRQVHYGCCRSHGER